MRAVVSCGWLSLRSVPLGLVVEDVGCRCRGVPAEAYHLVFLGAEAAADADVAVVARVFRVGGASCADGAALVVVAGGPEALDLA